MTDGDFNEYKIAILQEQRRIANELKTMKVAFHGEIREIRDKIHTLDNELTSIKAKAALGGGVVGSAAAAIVATVVDILIQG